MGIFRIILDLLIYGLLIYVAIDYLILKKKYKQLNEVNVSLAKDVSQLVKENYELKKQNADAE